MKRRSISPQHRSKETIDRQPDSQDLPQERHGRPPSRRRRSTSSDRSVPRQEILDAAHSATTPKEKPNYRPSGLLAAETNSVAGIVLKYHEPAESRLPAQRWRLHVFKNNDQLCIYLVDRNILFGTVAVHLLYRQSAHLFGREQRVVDVLLEHPSCSKQHAVIQFRYISSLDAVKPYLLDLESANGTLLNKIKIDSRRFYELKSGDVINFGASSRDYVLLKEEDLSRLESASKSTGKR